MLETKRNGKFKGCRPPFPFSKHEPHLYAWIKLLCMMLCALLWMCNASPDTGSTHIDLSLTSGLT